MEGLGNAYKQAKQQVSKLTNKQYTSNLLGSTLEELARESTAKELPGPDPRANAAFVEAINSASDGANDSTASELLAVLKRRLAMDNAHKQWLAICLISDILRQCPNSVDEQQKQELLNCVAEITKHPSNKTVNPNRESPSQSIRKAKSAAIEMLRTHGQTGQNALRSVVGLGGAAEMQRALQQSLEAHQVEGNQSGGRSWDAIVRDTTTAIETIKGHCELVNELLLGDGPGDFEGELLNELVTEMAMYSSTFEPLLGQLTTYETPEAEALMAQALEAYDLISSCQQLASDVAEAHATGVDGTESFASPAKGQQQGAAVSSGGGAAAASSDFDALGLGELQSALDSTAAATAQLQQQPPAPAAAAVDPFLAVASADPFASSAPAPTSNPNNPFMQQQEAPMDPFAAMATGQDPFAAAAPAAAPAAAAAVDPFAALSAPVQPSRAPPPPPAPAGHLTPDALLEDLTRAPKAGGPPKPGAPMKSGGSYSANNPFAAAAAAPVPPQQQQQQPPVQAVGGDDWDMFFKDRDAAAAQQ